MNPSGNSSCITSGLIAQLYKFQDHDKNLGLYKYNVLIKILSSVFYFYLNGSENLKSVILNVNSRFSIYQRKR